MKRSIIPLLALAAMGDVPATSATTTIIIPRTPDPVESDRFTEPSRGGKARSGARANSAAKKRRLSKRRRGW